MKYCIFLLCLFFTTIITSQKADITKSLYGTYETYKESSLNKRRIRHHHLQPLISKYDANPNFTVKVVGRSMEGRALSLISVGTGPTNVFLWSQMHGNESTATQAIFDILNCLASNDFKEEKAEILSNLTLHFLPMLNPDGAERFQRRNMLGVDINRDALRLQSPESKTLKKVRDSLEADFGFNLHDQSTYHNAKRTEKPATISLLAPAYNFEKTVNESRGNAMKIIAFINTIIQEYAPGQVSKYDDEFEPRAFGDNIQKWGTSTILIESGGYANDMEKQQIRKLNYVGILSAIYSIANENYKNISLSEYEKIPENDRKLFDLKIVNATHKVFGKNYTIDLGMNNLEVDLKGNEDFWYSSRIIDQGDLSTYYGYQTFDATGYTIERGKIYPKTLDTIDELETNTTDFYTLLKLGYTYVRIKNMPPQMIFSPLPIHITGKNYKLNEFKLTVGINPTFILKKDGIIKYAVVNGFLIDLAKDKEVILQEFTTSGKNAMRY